MSPVTAQTYEYIVNKYLIPALGQITLTQLRPDHLQHLHSEKLLNGRADGKGGLSARTVRYLHVTLHKALKSAVKMGMIARNVADAVEAPKLNRHEMQTMNESDLNLFLEIAKDTPYYALFYTALFTGMRRSELLALRWSDVDLKCTASVIRTFHQLHDGKVIFGEPKTGKSRRMADLSSSTAIVLREHKKQQALLKQGLGLKLTDADLIFSKNDGNPLLPDSVTQAWRHLAIRTGFRGIRLYGTRHTHASLMLKQGIHPKIVQERLGHASIQITLDTYFHVAPGLRQAAANRFDEVLSTIPEHEAFEKVH